MNVRMEDLSDEYIGSLVEMFLALEKNGDVAFFNPHRYQVDDVQSILRRKIRDQYVVLLDGDRVIAYGMLRGWDDGYAIPSLGIAVHPEFRRMGLSGLMMRHLHQIAKKMGATKIRLRVRRDNTRALSVYIRNGYVFGHDEEEGGYLVGYKVVMEGVI